ncbi:MAG TPA: DUF3152 domain-containing protein [Mycobacteriales bacterium]|nr:DUF3152 domain-containing protein [Mycobacteriales bacterium]
MTGLRLTRRGRLLLQTFPVFLVVAVAAYALTHHGTPAGAAAVRAAATTSPPATTRAPAVTTPAPPAATASPTPRATPSPTPRPIPSRTAFAPTGRLAVVPGRSAVHGSGPLRKFIVEVEAGLPDDGAAFAAAVERVLFDQRSWGGGGRLSFQRVDSGPVAFRVTLATPATTDRLCRPLDTGGIYSCYQGGRSVLNAMRWHDGAAAYTGDLASYRIYMVNHEVGHALGHGHRHTCGAGGLAPVMVQQTKSLYGCRRNPWPLSDER